MEVFWRPLWLPLWPQTNRAPLLCLSGPRAIKVKRVWIPLNSELFQHRWGRNDPWLGFSLPPPHHHHIFTPKAEICSTWTFYRLCLWIHNYQHFFRSKLNEHITKRDPSEIQIKLSIKDEEWLVIIALKWGTLFLLLRFPNIFHPKPITASAEVDLRKWVQFLRLQRRHNPLNHEMWGQMKWSFNKCQLVPLPASRCQPVVEKESNTNYKGRFY